MSAAVTAPARRGGGPAARSRREAVLRSLASGVAVLTVRCGDRLHGTTVSTLTSVSRRPLIVGACLRPGSVFTDLVLQEGRFAASVLRADQAPLARWFADSGRPDGAAQFDGLDWDTGAGRGEDDAPLLHGAVAHLRCRLSSCVPVGDHEVLLGVVADADADGGAPLLSYAGELHAPQLGEALTGAAARPASGAAQPAVHRGERSLSVQEGVSR